MIGSRADLARVRAALDADPFAEPVSVMGFDMVRRDARRIERELTAKFSARPVGSPVTALHNAGGGHTPTPAVALSATTLPEGARAPNREALSGFSDLRFHEAI